MLIRLGIPKTGGSLVAAARGLGAPILLSANAFSRPWPRDRRGDMDWPGFRRPSAGLDGMDVALDSAGFVAMVLHRGFPWSVGEYVALAGSFPWAWWAQMDCCCEPEVAGNRESVLLRVAETARLLGLCRREAADRGVAPPMPVLQGWLPDDYARSADLAPLWDWPDLVGVGSVCRRDVAGPSGLVAVVESLDRLLPRHVRLHLFGVKGTGMGALRGHDRIASVDSQAWDMAARREATGSCTTAVRIRHMAAWYRRQLGVVEAGGWAMQQSLDFAPTAAPAPIDDEWLQLIAAGEIDMRSVNAYRIMEAAQDD